jgi:PmbA protein
VPELIDIANQVVAQAKPGEQIEAYVIEGRETAVKVFDSDIESFSQADSAGVGIRVVSGSKQGFAYAGSLDPEIVSETLAEARDNAGFGTPDEFVAIAEPDGVAAVELDLYRSSLADVTADEKIEIALELERRVRAGDKRIRQVPSATYADVIFEAALATSTGIRTTNRRTMCNIATYAIANDGADDQTGYGFSVGRQLSDLDTNKVVADAIDRATRMLGAKKPASAKLTVVLDQDITSTYLSVLGSTLNGESVLKGRSLFADRVGQTVASPAFTLVDDPTIPEAFGAGEYDGEGLASRRTPLISNGVLDGFVYNTYAARRAGTASTANAVRGFKSGPGVGCRALVLEPGTQSQAEIIAGIDHGLLVQSVSGIHSGVNPISGDFSVGAEGIMIRDGQLAEPVREITIASTIQRMLQGVVAVGNDLEWLPGSAAGLTLAMADVSMSGA